MWAELLSSILGSGGGGALGGMLGGAMSSGGGGMGAGAMGGLGGGTMGNGMQAMGGGTNGLAAMGGMPARGFGGASTQTGAPSGGGFDPSALMSMMGNSGGGGSSEQMSNKYRDPQLAQHTATGLSALGQYKDMSSPDFGIAGGLASLFAGVQQPQQKKNDYFGWGSGL